jgi:hypothetical protein
LPAAAVVFSRRNELKHSQCLGDQNRAESNGASSLTNVTTVITAQWIWGRETGGTVRGKINVEEKPE